MTMNLRIQVIGAMLLGPLLACGTRPAPEKGPSPAIATASPDDRRPYREFIKALENTLIEVNELERMGGGIRDRMILVNVKSLVRSEDQADYSHALVLNYAKIQSLRLSLKTNEGVQEVLSRAGHSLNDLIAIDPKPEGAVILYYQP
jgi:hypothetical protein